MDFVKYKCLCCCFKEDEEHKKEKKPKRKKEEWEKCCGRDRETGQRTCCWETPLEWGKLKYRFLFQIFFLISQERFFLAFSWFML